MFRGGVYIKRTCQNISTWTGLIEHVSYHIFSPSKGWKPSHVVLMNPCTDEVFQFDVNTWIGSSDLMSKMFLRPVRHRHPPNRPGLDFHQAPTMVTSEDGKFNCR